jgi:hypothetical protein
MAATTTELWPSLANTVMAPWKHTTSLPARRSAPSKENKAAESQQVSSSSVVLGHYTDLTRRHPNFEFPTFYKKLTFHLSLVHDLLP